MKRTPTQILAEATSAMVQGHDVTGMLATLVRGCGEALSARAVCVLIRSDDGQIELLSSSSHATAELELFQALQATGPCIDAISGVSAVSVTGSADILARWPVVGRAIIEGGYQSVLASPLRWRGGKRGCAERLVRRLVAEYQGAGLACSGVRGRRDPGDRPGC